MGRIVGGGFDEGLDQFTYLETDKLVAKLNGDVGPQRDRRDVELARTCWSKALEGSTLARPNEQSERRSAESRKADSAAGGKPAAREYLTWQEVAVEEAKYICQSAFNLDPRSASNFDPSFAAFTSASVALAPA